MKLICEVLKKLALKLLSSDTVEFSAFDKLATCCGQFIQQIHKIPLVLNAVLK